ncbi:hypothetical protein SAMN05216257_101335 [Meinhardsimonia xiamenensis]|jgi:hypothetical protein|uniref:Uncharacterized protein n=1 Tax=Meinhardsimonia xiamenensis TaxID=990712 RepID=A0A1G8YJX8_9RHOB|nr:hypothetical protein [Meinhardsimonia xiamenensis]PRX37313.1 hypothetical protein LV81_01090 [Meinhardsimonia xiamenensis]SDK02485.1 hypothetical protein SAMN05216257_101335 [Meinhardsimonia xiamenensis]
MKGVIRLRLAEQVVIDGQLARSRNAEPNDRSSPAAPAVALEELAYWLYHFDAALRRGDRQELAERAGRIATLAEPLGLRSLAGVARDLLTLFDAGGQGSASHWLGPARAAVAARLVRVGEASILRAWELQDMPG